MDQILSHLVPTQRVGDSFNWWVGQIEATNKEIKDSKAGNRYKVRIVGDHPCNKEIIDTQELPWASVMMPVNVPFMPGGEGGASPQLKIGCWVIGFYIDQDNQKPLIIGSIGQVPGATKKIEQRTPDTGCFVTALSESYNPNVDGSPKDALAGGQTNGGGKEQPGSDDGTNRRIIGLEREKWCQEAAEKCKESKNFWSKIKFYLGEFLAEVQNSNGNIGSFYVSEGEGLLGDGVSIVRNYTNKINKIIREFLAEVKGYIYEKMKAAIKDLVNWMLNVTEDGNSLSFISKWANKQLKSLGCKMEDIGERLKKWLTDILMEYVTLIYRAAACQVDQFVNGLLSQANSMLEDVLDTVLGPIQDILGAIAEPLNIIGQAVNRVMTILGISCSGPENKCAKYKKVCTDGSKKDDKDDKNKYDAFLDNVLNGIDNMFPEPWNKGDANQYTCEEAFTGNPLSETTVGFFGGVFKDLQPRNQIPAGTFPGDPRDEIETFGTIVYSIDDIEVNGGDIATFTVTRRGYLDYASSLSFKTLNKGSAISGSDYIETSGILGFQSGEVSKKIDVRTLYSDNFEEDKQFYLKLEVNSPNKDSGIESFFDTNIGVCTITKANLKDPGNPVTLKPENPFDDDTAKDYFSPEDIDEILSSVENENSEDISNTSTSPEYSISADKSVVREGEFISYTITTRNVENGTVLYYTLSGNEITKEDIVDDTLFGNFIIENNSGKVTIGIQDDGVVEDEEVLKFTINGTGESIDVLITSSADDTSVNDFSDFDQSSSQDFNLSDEDDDEDPTVNSNDITTDDSGGIIDIPIDNPGRPYAEPPEVFIDGQGIGAVGTALLDNDGFVTEIRIKSPGYGYKLNTTEQTGKRCIIDTFTLLSPGTGYSEPPKIYINGELGVAETIINEDGFVIGARTLNRELTFTEMPEIIIVGGGGYGARMMASLICLDTESLTAIGSTKVGTGRYVDCP